MAEYSIMEMIKWVVSAYVVMLIVSVSVMYIQLSGINDYKQYVNVQIERTGGLTAEALEKIDTYSDKYHNGLFEIVGGERPKVQYGEVVEYEIKAVVPIKLLPVPPLEIDYGGISVSKVR